MFGEAAGFVLGFVLVLTGVLVGKARGWVKDRERMLLDLDRECGRLSDLTLEQHTKLRELADHRQNDGNGASDAAIAQLAGRLTALEKQLAAQDMTILDTAEKVTNRLQDRLRKRRESEVPPEDHDEAPNDPNVLLMRARAFYAQPQLPFGEENAG